MLISNDQPLLDSPGAVSRGGMRTIAENHYEEFDAKRRRTEAIESDAEDLKTLEELEKDVRGKGCKA